MTMDNMPPEKEPVEVVAQRRHLAAIWLIPIVAGLIALYLGWHDYQEHGPVINITFKTAQGLAAGQTQVKYKGVALGTVEKMRLSQDGSQVVAEIRMTGAAKPFLTDHAHFWVVRPELNVLNASDLETLVSGSYIQMDPGSEGGDEQTEFTGLDSAPMDRTTESGTIFVLKTNRLASITTASPLYYRDINVGEVLGYDIGDGFDPITITAFVRAPYDRFVRAQSRFWNVSSLSINFGAQGIGIETQSLRSLLAGGIAFMTPPDAKDQPPAPAQSVFTLYDDLKSAKAATFDRHLAYAAYFRSSVKDLAPGAPVLIYGIPVGEVTGMQLTVDAKTGQPTARVSFNVEPDRSFTAATPGQPFDAAVILRELVEKGLRVKLETANLITGQKELVLEFSPDAAPAPPVMEKDVTILPAASAADNLMDAIGDIAGKLNSIPFDQIGSNLDHLIKSADQTLGGQDMKQAVHDLSVTMSNAAELAKNANTNASPALQKLPEISAQLQEAVTHANALMNGLNNGYGDGSDFQRDSHRVLDEVNDAARSIRLLSDYLERHPESLISGKTGQKDKP